MRRSAEEALRALVDAEPELVLEAHGPEEAQRIVGEHRLGHGSDDALLEIPCAAVGIEPLVGAHADRDRVEGEVARGEIGLDAVREGREVDGLLALVRDDTPRPMALGERERGALEPARVAQRRCSRIGAGDVEVEDGATEQLVADRPADDPGLLVGEHLANAVIHPSPPDALCPSAC